MEFNKSSKQTIFTQEYYSIDPKSFGQIANLKKKVKQSSSKSVKLNARFFRPYCVVYLDQVLCSINKEKDKSVFSKDPNLNSYLNQCGFEFLHSSAELGELFPSENIIRLIRFIDSTNWTEEVTKWLEDIVLKYIQNCSKPLRKKIVESLWEIVNNGFTHGQSEFGLSCCGQYYPQKKYFEIAFYDSGYGLANRVWDFTGEGRFLNNDSDCIEWAMQKGNSTSRTPDAGLGLYLLREFLKVNQGAFQIIAGDGYFGNMEDEIETKHTIKNSIEGTLVNIRINVSDNILYKLKGEK